MIDRCQSPDWFVFAEKLNISAKIVSGKQYWFRVYRIIYDGNKSARTNDTFVCVIRFCCEYKLILFYFVRVFAFPNFGNAIFGKQKFEVTPVELFR